MGFMISYLRDARPLMFLRMKCTVVLASHTSLIECEVDGDQLCEVLTKCHMDFS